MACPLNRKICCDGLSLSAILHEKGESAVLLHGSNTSIKRNDRMRTTGATCHTNEFGCKIEFNLIAAREEKKDEKQIRVQNKLVF